MRLACLRPVGEYLPLRASESAAFSWPPDYRLAWVDSGTTALALALRAVARKAAQPSPAVLLPGYTCPDVVSAALWAGLRPVLVDTRPGTPWLDEERLAACLSRGVVAIVAPHFLGIRHPLGRIRELCRVRGITLVEDSAQLGPTSAVFIPEAPLVVLSFGRGKPVPAGGGLLLYADAFANEVETCWHELPGKPFRPLGWTLRAAAQNAAMTRLGYGVVRSVPGLHVGETRFKALDNPRRLGPDEARAVSRVLNGWDRTASGATLAIREMLSGLGFEDTAIRMGWDGKSPLLRYPLLLPDAAAREQICEALHSQGLGVTAFYGRALPDLDGMPAVEAPAGLDRARDFASRLVTLPCHSDVGLPDVERISAALAAQQD